MPVRAIFRIAATTAALGLALVACPGCWTVSGASANAIPAVKVQASTDFDCPQSQIRVVKEWGGQFDVVGCGQKATYNAACDGLHCSAAPRGQVVPDFARPEPTPNGAGQ
jgi:hypothetical protein